MMYYVVIWFDLKVFKKKHTNPRLVELETEIEHLKRENETLKRENTELKETNNKLKQSLDEAVRSTRPQPQPPPRRLIPPNFAELPARSETADSSRPTDSELQRQLNKAIQQLSETRQQLSNVQERLTVSEQVTAATQRRQLVQEGAYENLPSDSVYEKLRFDPTQEHVYAKLQPPSHRGCIRYIQIKIKSNQVYFRQHGP